MRFCQITIYFFVFHLLTSCANISSPTGGPKDTLAPLLDSKQSFPKNKSVNFSGNTIELVFIEERSNRFEDIALNNLQEQLLITPAEENPYKYTIRRNHLRLIFEKNFSPNTTYTFNFRDAVKDITEGNISPELIFSFSTGNYLDSISISGIVTDQKNNAAIGGAIVSLYSSVDTLSPLNSKPLYFSKTNKSGNFEFLNIRNGFYDLYAIQDQNQNLTYQEPEKFAFKKNIDFNSSQKNIELKIAKIDTKPPKITSIKNTEEASFINLSEGIDSIFIKSKEQKKIISQITKDGKTFIIYNNFNTKDSLSLNLFARDSSGNILNTDFKVFFPEEKNIKEKKEAILSLNFTPADKKLNPKEINISITFSRPVTQYEIKNIKIKEDTILNELKEEEIRWLQSNLLLQIKKTTKAKDSVIISIPDSSFSSINVFNRKISEQFTFLKEEEYASIKALIKTEKPSYIIELLDGNFKTIASRPNAKEVYFNYLKPGTYYLRSIEDKNRNGKWDQANLIQDIQAEPIFLYKDKIDLRANWEIQDIVFQF